MAEGQNECKMTPLDEIWRHEAGALIFNSLFLPKLFKGGTYRGSKHYKTKTKQIGFYMYVPQSPF